MKKTILLSFVFSPCFSIAQQDTSNHVVEKGETLYQISRKYNVVVSEILLANPNITPDLIYPDQIIKIPTPEASNNPNENNEEYFFHIVAPGETKIGLMRRYNVSINQLEQDNPQIIPILRAGDQIRIRKTKKEAPESKKTLTLEGIKHEVKAGETLYALSRQYKISLKELVETNKDHLGKYLQIGQILHIPDPKQVKKPLSEENSYIVERGDTKFGLAKKFGTTIKELEQLNPHIITMLRTGDMLILPEYSVRVISEKEKSPESAISASMSHEAIAEYQDYTIQPKETLFSLSKKAQMTQEELLDLNPKLQNGVQTGMVIKMPSFVIQEPQKETTEPSTVIVKATETEIKDVKKDNTTNLKTKPLDFEDLSKSIQTESIRKLMLLLPFEQNDFFRYMKGEIQGNENEKYYQFYSGVLTALDSINKLGIKTNVSFLNTNTETHIIRRELSTSKPDLIIGKYHHNQELKDNNLPFVYPFTDDFKTSSPDFYRATPSEQTKLQKLLGYLTKEQANLIVVSDIEKTSDKELIAQKAPQTKFAVLKDKTNIDAEQLKNFLEPDKKNYIIINTEQPALFLNLTNILIKYLSEYNLQLAVAREIPKDIATIRLQILKTIYVLPTDKPNIASNQFEKTYSEKFQKIPQSEAFLGFDVTYDSMLRLSQNESFKEAVRNHKTRMCKQVFDYTPNTHNGLSNSAVYLFYYDVNNNANLIEL